MKHVLLQQYINSQLSKLGFTTDSDINFVFFWKYRTKEKGVLDEACCCQWWYSKVNYNGITFLTAEHAMMYTKASMFKDPIAMAAILEERHPWTVKAIGRQVQNFVSAQWDNVSYDIVRDVNIAKFQQDKKLNEWIRSLPKNTLFVEASPIDRIWGIGLENDGLVDLTDFSKWQGQNKLGFAITEAFQKITGVK